MRVIAGTLGGRVFAGPQGQRTHPMSDKMRGALFNKIGDLSGLRVLDAFAGSGALSFEAASRGAERVLAIEKDRRAQLTITQNIAALDVADAVQLIRANTSAWLQTSQDDFDLILLDPPYDDLQLPLLQQLCDRLRPGGQVVLSWPGKLSPPSFERRRLQSSKQYGDGSLHVFSR